MAKKVVVIGGGASGLIAGYFSAKSGCDTTIIEQNEKTGKKIYITGKGRCNVTNDCDQEEFLANVATNPKFLLSAIYAFSPADLMDLLERNGLRLKVERGNRVFPASDKSSDVIKCLTNMCLDAGVKINLNERVIKILSNGESVCGVLTTRGEYKADKVIVATGGFSYKQTGSTGDGYKFAENLGHKIVQPTPALCGLEIEEDFCQTLMGLSLKNVSLTAKVGNKVLFFEQGEMIFTHFGVSGPLVLTCSSKINKKIDQGVELFLDLKPALSEKQLDARILRDFAELKNKSLRNSLHLLLPKNLIPIIIEKSGVNGDKSTSIITKEERAKLCYTIKNLRMKVCALSSIEQAIITSGGVAVNQINPQNMESKLIKGLHFAGEVIDVDAYTGGFNLQIAFSTGYLAGYSDKE